MENDPDIIDKDIAMMQQAKCNVMSVGIFSWAKLEPREGYLISPGWILSSINCMPPAFMSFWPRRAARPAWMSQRYPQVLRVGAIGAGPARRPSQPLYVVTGLSRENPANQYPAGRTLFLTRRCWAGIFQRIWR